jgi:hypothetical protein
MASVKRRLYTGNEWQLGHALGYQRGKLIANAATPLQAASYERATLAIIEAVGDYIFEDDAAAYDSRGFYANGVREGQRYAEDEAAREYGHEAARA